MTNKSKPTAGPWQKTDDPNDECCWSFHVETTKRDQENSLYAEQSIADVREEADAILIAEAGTVYHETGLTPRELKEQWLNCVQLLKEGFEHDANDGQRWQEKVFAAIAATKKEKGE